MSIRSPFLTFCVFVTLFATPVTASPDRSYLLTMWNSASVSVKAALGVAASAMLCGATYGAYYYVTGAHLKHASMVRETTPPARTTVASNTPLAPATATASNTAATPATAASAVPADTPTHHDPRLAGNLAGLSAEVAKLAQRRSTRYDLAESTAEGAGGTATTPQCNSYRDTLREQREQATALGAAMQDAHTARHMRELPNDC